MKIETTFDPKTNRVEIRFDSQMQSMLSATSRVIAKFFDPETYVKVNRNLDPDREMELASGGRLILELIRSESKIVETDLNKVHWCLAFLSWSMLHMVEAGRPAAPLLPALTVFANLSALKVPRVALPPPSEMLDRDTTAPAIWKAYEGLQSARRAECEYLTVAQTYELSLALKKTLSPHPSLRRFLDFLDGSSLVYRVALEVLTKYQAAMEKGNGAS